MEKFRHKKTAYDMAPFIQNSRKGKTTRTKSHLGVARGQALEEARKEVEGNFLSDRYVLCHDCSGNDTIVI